MNIFEVFKYKDDSTFRIPEDGKFEEEYVVIKNSCGIKFLTYKKNGDTVPLTDTYIDAEYILESGELDV